MRSGGSVRDSNHRPRTVVCDSETVTEAERQLTARTDGITTVRSDVACAGGVLVIECC